MLSEHFITLEILVKDLVDWQGSMTYLAPTDSPVADIFEPFAALAWEVAFVMEGTTTYYLTVGWGC